MRYTIPLFKQKSIGLSNHQFGKQIRSILNLQIPSKVALAVSGGVDSMALAYLCKQFFKNYNTKVFAFTVNHNLRPEATSEAHNVHKSLTDLGINHEILTISWLDQIPIQKFESVARNERHKLLVNACKERGIKYLFLAHTIDDQLETFIMRLCKGSSIYGLSGMKELSSAQQIIDPNEDIQDSVKLVRPLLRYKKIELTKTCEENQVTWVEDPTNYDPTFTIRNSIRKLLAQPENLPVAIKPDSLINTLNNLSITRNDIEHEAKQTLQFMINKDLVFIDPSLGIASLTEFEGFSKLRTSVKAQIFLYIFRRISPIANLNYNLSSIDDLVRKIPRGLKKPENIYTSGLRVTVYPEKKRINNDQTDEQQLFSTTLNRLDEFTNSTTSHSSIISPQKYSFWRQRIHKYDQYKMTLIDVPLKQFEWSEWILFDNRFWIRLRKLKDIPTKQISIRLVYELTPVKQALNELLKLDKSYKWPFEGILASQPLFMHHSEEKNYELTTYIIGFPTLNKYISTEVEIECKLKHLDEDIKIPTKSLVNI